MSDEQDSRRGPAPVDALAAQLLECAAVVGQIVSGIEYARARGFQAAPVAEVAQALIEGSLEQLPPRYGEAELAAAAAILERATAAIRQNIFAASHAPAPAAVDLAACRTASPPLAS